MVQQAAEAGHRGFGHEDLGYESAPQRCLDEIGSLGEKAGGATSSHVAVQLHRRRHPVRAFGELRAAAPESVDVDGAFTSLGSAPLATSTSAVKAAGSLTAISERFLRFTSTTPALRPWRRP